jgi:hypothetical protein
VAGTRLAVEWGAVGGSRLAGEELGLGLLGLELWVWVGCSGYLGRGLKLQVKVSWGGGWSQGGS